MEKLTEWLTLKSQQPLSLLFFTFGSLLILLGVTTGITLPVFQQLSANTNHNKTIALILGGILLLISIVIHYIPSHRTKKPKEDTINESMPISMTNNFNGGFARRLSYLTATQRLLLSFIETQYTQYGLVKREAIARHFRKITGKNDNDGAEVYYRLEQLYLLGFVENKWVGQDEIGNDIFEYMLSTVYSKELGIAIEARPRPREISSRVKILLPWMKSDQREE